MKKVTEYGGKPSTKRFKSHKFYAGKITFDYEGHT